LRPISIYELRVAGKCPDLCCTFDRRQTRVNRPALVIQAATAGFELPSVPENYAAVELQKGRLIRMLEDWCPRFSGFHLYYPSRRQQSPASP
jgi:DNA-binding transcriptional LysR family regulator